MFNLSGKTALITGVTGQDGAYLAEFLLGKGYRVIPVNPGQTGKEILGQPVVGRLADIVEPIDMVDVFRAADALPSVVEEVLALNPDGVPVARMRRPNRWRPRARCRRCWARASRPR